MPIKVENLIHTYNKGLAYETIAVNDVSFEINDGETIGIIGHTGSGKSTLIQHLNGLLKPESGKIIIGDTDITSKGVTMIDIRKKIGLVFQYPEYQLFEETVYKDVSFGPSNLGLTEEEVDLRVKEAMDLVDMPFEEFGQRSPFELSGGQKRRIAIAGVIAMKPQTLILDEPTAGLDPKAHHDILNMIMGIKKKTGTTIILVSHNMDDIAERADRVFVLHQGSIVRQGTPSQVFSEIDYLTSIGLGVPYATEMASELNKKGFHMDKNVMSLDDLENVIVERLVER